MRSLQKLTMLAKLIFFPYEYVDSLDKLHHSLPNHPAVYSNLKQSNITEKEYQTVVKLWEEENWTSIRDLFIFYNNLDVGTFVEVIEKCVRFHKSKGLGLFKHAFSARRIAKRHLFTQALKGSFFSLIGKKDRDLN